MGRRRRKKWLPPSGVSCGCENREDPHGFPCMFCGEEPSPIWTPEMEELYRVERPEEYAEENKS